jgi:arylformamidase
MGLFLGIKNLFLHFKKLIMKLIDLSHTIENEMPVYPDTPKVSIYQFSTVEEEGYAEKKIELGTHIGTHMDAPAHMIAGGRTLDQFLPDQFFGKGLLIPFTHEILMNKSQELYLKSFEKYIEVSDFIILRTSWSRFWGQSKYFKDYPALDAGGASFLSSFNIKGIGIDTVSIDMAENLHFDAHHFLLEKEILIVENLCNLEMIIKQEFNLFVLPLKIKDSDGSPVRAIAKL